MKYIFLFFILVSVLAADAQKIRKAVRQKIKEKIEAKRDTVPATHRKPTDARKLSKGEVRTTPTDTVPQSDTPTPQAGEPPFNLDTVIINNLTLKARDWSFLTANVNLNDRDSATYSRLRLMRDQIGAQAGAGGWNANITVNGLPGQWIVNVYNFLQQMTVGVAKQMDPATTTAIRGKTNLQFWFDEIDARAPAIYLRDRDEGKHILLDQ